MDLDKIYYDEYGNECNILHLVKRCPEWAANRIQEGEKALRYLAEHAPQPVNSADAEKQCGFCAGAYLNPDMNFCPKCGSKLRR
jgi:hypothetical protein